MTNEQRIRALCTALGISGDSYKFLISSYRTCLQLEFSEEEAIEHVIRRAEEIGRLPALMRRQAV